MAKPPRKDSTDGNAAKPSATQSMFDAFSMGNAFWSPYLSISKVLLQTQNNATAYLKANRKLAEDMQALARKEHELIVGLSEQLLGHMTPPNWPGKTTNGAKPANLDAIFAQATNGIRELGQAWVDAQLRSLETLHKHTKKSKD